MISIVLLLVNRVLSIKTFEADDIKINENKLKHLKDSNNLLNFELNDLEKINLEMFKYAVPEEKIKSIFDRFYQVDYSSTRKYGGTGLGLAISKMLAEMMEGEISVKSVEGIGTIFTVVIKLKNLDLTLLKEIKIGKLLMKMKKRNKHVNI